MILVRAYCVPYGGQVSEVDAFRRRDEVLPRDGRGAGYDRGGARGPPVIKERRCATREGKGGG